MADETILTWNVPNWITVVLMAAIFFMLLGLVQKFIARKRSSENETS